MQRAAPTSAPAFSAGVLFLVLAGVLWGGGGPSGRMLSESSGLGPLPVAAFRLLLGGLVVLVVLLAMRAPRPRGRRAWQRLALVGLLMAQFQCCYFIAVSQGSVSLATLVTIGAAPVLVTLAEAALGHHRLSGGSVGVVALALVGLALLVGLPAPGLSTGELTRTAIFSLASAAGFAAFSLVARRQVRGLTGPTTIGYGFVLGGLGTWAVIAGSAVLAGGEILGADLRFTMSGLMWIAVLAVLPTAVPYLCYFEGLRSQRASLGALMALLEPLTGTLIAVIAFTERLSAATIVGALLLAASVVLASRAADRTITDHIAPATSTTRTSIT